MNPDEIYSSFRKTAADIQNLNKLEEYDKEGGVRTEKDSMSQDSGKNR